MKEIRDRLMRGLKHGRPACRIKSHDGSRSFQDGLWFRPTRTGVIQVDRLWFIHLMLKLKMQPISRRLDRSTGQRSGGSRAGDGRYMAPLVWQAGVWPAIAWHDAKGIRTLAPRTVSGDKFTTSARVSARQVGKTLPWRHPKSYTLRHHDGNT